MKTKIIYVMGLLLAATCSTGAFAKTADIKEVAVSVHDAYVPGGMYASSESFVVANLMLPNGCYHFSRYEVNDVTPFVHEAQLYADVTSGMCTMMIIMTHEVVQLGRLPSGTHTIRFLNGDGTYMEKQLVVQ